MKKTNKKTNKTKITDTVTKITDTVQNYILDFLTTKEGQAYVLDVVKKELKHGDLVYQAIYNSDFEAQLTQTVKAIVLKNITL